MSDTRTQSERKTSFQVCSLGGNTHGKSPALAPEPILLALKDEAGQLHFFLDPNWKTIVHKSDVEDVGLLLADFAEGAGYNADALFRRICSLNFGPLLTIKLEGEVADLSAFLSRYPHFVPFPGARVDPE